MVGYAIVLFAKFISLGAGARRSGRPRTVSRPPLFGLFYLAIVTDRFALSQWSLSFEAISCGIMSLRIVLWDVCVLLPAEFLQCKCRVRASRVQGPQVTSKGRSKASSTSRLPVIAVMLRPTASRVERQKAVGCRRKLYAEGCRSRSSTCPREFQFGFGFGVGMG